MTKHIIIFSLVSAALHAGLLMVVSSSENIIEVGAPFRVSIMAAREQVPAPGKQAVTEKPVKQKTQPEKKPQPTPVQTVSQKVAKKPAVKTIAKHPIASASSPQLVSKTTVDVQTESTTDSAEASTAMSAQTTSLLRAQLQQAFRLQFHYPRLAVRRGWQGEVRLTLVVAANGMLENIHILKSSGHGILDRAALNSLNSVEQLPAATVLLNGRDLALELPVQYRLL